MVSSVTEKFNRSRAEKVKRDSAFDYISTLLLFRPQFRAEPARKGEYIFTTTSVFLQLLAMQLNSNITVEPNSTVENETPNSISLNSFMGIFIMCFYIVVYSTSTVGNLVVLCICAKNGRKNAAFQPTRTEFLTCTSQILPSRISCSRS